MTMHSDSFNARNIKTKDVAATFVYSDDFERVTRNCHSIILGPRGSGKTTILKMMTPSAIAAWNSHRERQIKLPFSVVYIPTDIVWHHQLLYPEKESMTVTPEMEKLGRGAVLASVLLALIESFSDLVEGFKCEDNSREIELSQLLSAAWQLKETIPKLSHLHLSIKRRTIELGRALNRCFMGDSLTKCDDLLSWCDNDFLDCADYAIEAFDLIFERDREHRWALCFDELELAPLWLQSRLFKMPRSTRQKILFKLSSSPDPEVFSSVHVTPSDDVEVIKLWRSSMVQRRQFCSEIASFVVRRVIGENVDPQTLFGVSDENEVDMVDGGDSFRPYTEGSTEWNLIKEVASWDASFASALTQRGIDPNNPTAQNISEKDSILRKAKPIAALRKKFVKSGSDGRLRRRSRKSSGSFSGVPAVYDISDGNPRRLIRVCEELCQQATKKADGSFTVTKEVQSRIVLNIAKLFKDYLRMIPGAQKKDAKTGDSVELYSLLREIGRYFSAGLLIGPFPLDPKCSFTVDNGVSDTIIEVLRIASYHGAIVKVDADAFGVLGDLRDCRFRLCYTLSPLLQLPLRLYEPMALSTCLQNKRGYLRRISVTETQLEFGQ